MSDRFAGGIKANATSVSMPVLLRKTADNTELTAIASTAVTASYRRQGAAVVTYSVSALGSITAAWAAGGWFEADATNQPGTYRLDVPDAAFATGADWVIVAVKVANAYVYYERFNLETKGAAEVTAQIAAGVVLSGYASGQDPATLLLVVPANKLATDVAGRVSVLGMIQVTPFTAVAGGTGTLFTLSPTGLDLTAGAYNGQPIKFTAGANAGEWRPILAYTVPGGTPTVAIAASNPFAHAPGADAGVIG